MGMKPRIEILKEFGEKLTGKPINVKDDEYMYYGVDIDEIFEQITEKYTPPEKEELPFFDFGFDGDITQETCQRLAELCADNIDDTIQIKAKYPGEKYSLAQLYVFSEDSFELIFPFSLYTLSNYYDEDEGKFIFEQIGYDAVAFME